MRLLYNQVKAYKRVNGGIINALENSARRDIIKALILTCGLMLTDIPMVIGAEILEGTAKTSSDVTIYEANVEKGQTYNSVFGVRSGNTDSKNYGYVTINEGNVTSTVYGCRNPNVSDLSKASCNKVNIINSKIGTDSTWGTVYGGYAYGGNKSASVQSNSVEISGGSVNGYVYSGYAEGATISVTNNNVLLKNVLISKTVYGGCAFNTASWLSMLRNEVTVENCSIMGSVYGGYASGSATAANSNTVTIKGDNTLIKGSVYGGYALSSNSDANSNTVIIEGGKFKNRIYGGVGTKAENNTIVLKGGDLCDADLYGYSDGRKSHGGNTLEVWASNIQVRSAQNFENYYFIVPDGMANQADKYMLKAGTPVNLSDTKVGVAIQNGTVLNNGDQINLIDKTEGTASWVPLEGIELKGGTLFTNYNFNLSTTGENKTLVATANLEPYGHGGLPAPIILLPPKPAGQADEKAKSLSEGQAASVALLGEANELAAGRALADAKEAARAAGESGDLAAFATLGYGRSLYDTGSHVNMHNTDFILGIAREYSYSNRDLLLGAFFETGRGSYSTHNDFENDTVDGNGKARYYGGGLMLQMESSRNKGLYFQATGRIGHMKNEWNSGNFSEYVDYDTSHRYYGATLGLGYQNKLSENRSYNLYGKFIWTRQNGDDANINGEQFQFDDINSVKARIGLRMNYKGYKTVKPFWGIAWEREFKGEARASVNGYNIDTPELKGDSGLFEFGIKYKPDSSSNWQLDLTATGYTGKRRGIEGQACFNFRF